MLHNALKSILLMMPQSEVLLLSHAVFCIFFLTKSFILSHVLRKLSVLCCKKYLIAINSFIIFTIKTVKTLFLSKAVKQTIFFSQNLFSKTFEILTLNFFSISQLMFFY